MHLAAHRVSGNLAPGGPDFRFGDGHDAPGRIFRKLVPLATVWH